MVSLGHNGQYRSLRLHAVLTYTSRHVGIMSWSSYLMAVPCSMTSVEYRSDEMIGMNLFWTLCKFKKITSVFACMLLSSEPITGLPGSIMQEAVFNVGF